MTNGGEWGLKEILSQKWEDNLTKVGTNIPPVELFRGQIPIQGTGGRGRLERNSQFRT